jgi:hypothetical protein
MKSVRCSVLKVHHSCSCLWLEVLGVLVPAFGYPIRFVVEHSQSERKNNYSLENYYFKGMRQSTGTTLNW